MSACQAGAEGIQTPYRELGLAGWHPILPPLLFDPRWGLLEVRVSQTEEP